MSPWHALFRLIRRTGAVAAVLVPVLAQASGKVQVEGDVLLQLRSSNALPRILQDYRLSLVSRFGARPIFRVHTIGATDVKTALAALAGDPDVLLAEANVVQRAPEAEKNNPWAIGTSSQYVAQWAGQALRLVEAQRLSTGRGVRVAVLDTGVDASHPSLAGRLLPGRDFVDGDLDPSEVAVGTTPNAAYGHGTHVAGLVAMVAPAARIMPLRVLDTNGEGNTWVLGEALLHAVDPDGDPSTDDGAHVINLSLGTLTRTRLFDRVVRIASCTPPDPADPTDDRSDPGFNGDALRCASGAGPLVVAAAGNDGSSQVRVYPAAERSTARLLSVTASNASGRLASFGNYGSWVMLAAPGEGLTSALPGAAWGTWSGTSMAAPLVSGAVALLRSAAPHLSTDEVIRCMRTRTTALGNTAIRQVDPTAALRSVILSGRCR